MQDFTDKTQPRTLIILCLYQHAVVFVNGEQYYGAKASINVWAPRVADQYEFSLSQVWLISGSFSNDLNTIEAGWQASLLYTETSVRELTCCSFL